MVSLLYKRGMSPRELAEAVLDDVYGDTKIELPINPFELMRKYGIIYQFMSFKDLEGIYLVPEDENDIAVVGINYKRKITRQRYTAAHELCHHLKDRRNEACPIGNKDEVERFAENFAAELLMPRQSFLSVAKEYMKDGKVTLDDALHISERFGVSFRACVLRLAYTFHILDGSYEQLNKRITDYKPDNKKTELGMEIEPIKLVKQAVDSYEFYFEIEENIVWYQFKNDFIYNENRMEGLNLDQEEVAEIVTDLRMNRQNSIYCKETYEDIIQVLGHAELYDYILTTDDKLDIYSLLKLNKQLFQFAPYPEEAGKTRTHNNLVLGTKFETVDCKDVAMELIKLQGTVENLMKNIGEISISTYVEECLKIHHRITQIHPFRDGNGRSSRALLNWMFRLKGIPPIYFKLTEKEDYYMALERADSISDYDSLLRVTIREIFRTIIRMS